MTEKALNLYKKFRNDKVFFGTAIMSTGMFLGSIINYGFQLALGRLLTVENFGVFNSLLSLMYVFTIPAMAFGVAIVKLVSDLKSKDKFDTLTNLYWKFALFGLGFGLLTFSLIYFLRDSIAGYLNISDISIILPFGLFLAVNLLNVIPDSYLKGLLRF